MERVRATTAGIAPSSGGASHSRVIPTPKGTFHVKFARPAGEGRRAPINELLGNRLLEHLGCSRPNLVVVQLPAAIRKSDPSLADILTPLGLGMERLPATDLDAAGLLTAADTAPEEELLAQYVVLTWMQNSDHGGGNWMGLGDRVIAVDLASAPTDAVWSGGKLGEDRTDHGNLRARIDRLEDDVRSSVMTRMRTLSAKRIAQLMAGAPQKWATAAERRHVATEMDRTKEALVAEFE